MTLDDLIASFRSDADDAPSSIGGGDDDLLWKDAEVARFLGEAEEEAAIRKRLLFDDYTLSIVQIAVVANRSSYPLDSRMFEVTKARLLSVADSACIQELHITTRDELDEVCPRWRDERGRPRYLVQDDTRVVLPGIVDGSYMLRLEGYRTPLSPITSDSDGETIPEIGAIHHRFLVHWALHRAYSKPDTEMFNPQKAAVALAAFEQYFGLRPDADLRKDQRANQPHVIAVHRW
ncbi:DUF6682 family protein [Variovorax sp. RCC_210]|uniref:phage adaptor protein n=1 Tax=Variovorax sp. RCC_210 TaxID=3239217 RepID=UPI003523D4A6